MPINLIISKLETFGQVKKQGNGYICHCPAHEDKKSSLSITEQEDKVLLHCHAGCESKDILRAISLTWKDLYPNEGHKISERSLKTYDYGDENGKLIHQKVRYPNKKFLHRRPDGSGGWIYNMKDVQRVPYNLPIVIATIKAGQSVYIVEGEKDADNLISLGLTATTNSGGAGKWTDSLSAYFKGATVIIVPDNDKPGKAHALKVAKSLHGKAKVIKIVNLPELNDKEDVSDWLKAGNSKDDLIELVNETKLWQPKKEKSIGILMSEVKTETVEWLWPGYIPLGKLTVIDGDPGQGKSTLTLDIASRLSTGDTMPGSTETREPAGVAILSAEDGLGDTIKPRLIATGADLSRILAFESTKDAETGKEQPYVLPDNLDLIKGGIKRVNAKLLIVDPLMAFLSGNVNSHRDQDIRRVLHLLANLAEDAGVALIVIRHLNKTSTNNSLYRGGGSIGIIGAARSGLLVANDPDDESKRVLASTKCNLAKKPDSLSFHLEDCNDVSKVVWNGSCSHTADTLLTSSEEQGALQDAENVLKDILANGPVPANDAKKQAREAGIADRTRDRAKASLKIKSKKDSMQGHWLWELPKIANHSNGNVGGVGNVCNNQVVNDNNLEEPCEERQDSVNSNNGNVHEQAKQMIIKEFNATEIPEGAPF